MVWGSLRRLCLVTWSSSIRSLMVSFLTMSRIMMSYNKLMTSSRHCCKLLLSPDLVLPPCTNCLPVTMLGVSSSAPLVLVTPATLATPWSSPDTLSTLERLLSLIIRQRSHHNPVSRRQYHLLLDSFHTRQLGSRLSWPEVREVTLDLRDRLRDGARDTSLDPDDGVTMEERGEES